jgi:serine/threonine-protein kinase
VNGAPTEKDSAAAAPVPEFLSAGRSFARYQIVRCIGVGGMGSVFEATHTLLRKQVAIKAMHSSLGRSEASRARFLREAETVARIRHPNVVDISDVGIEQGIPFLVMEFLEGEDLASLLARTQRLSVARAVDIVLPVIAGLSAVHRLGIVHRDIKPENVFLALDAHGDTVPKLVDFGVSKDLEAGAHAGSPLHHTVAGTPYYMAPEQARGSAVLDARADQYAVGVLLYQCLAGVRPFQSESLLELIHLIDSGDYQPLRDHCHELPEQLEALIARAMARAPDARFPNTEAFGQALAVFASEPVRRACERDFALERRPSLPLREGPAQDQARPSAPTVASEPALARSQRPSAPPSVPTRAFPRRSVSGVQARDGETLSPGALPSAEARSALSSAEARSALSSAEARSVLSPTEAASASTQAHSASATRPRAAFVAAALGTLFGLLVVLALLLARRAPEPTGGSHVEAKPRPAPAQAAPVAPPAAVDSAHGVAPASRPGVVAPPGVSPQPRRSGSKTRRQEAPNERPAPSDIQLSR